MIKCFNCPATVEAESGNSGSVFKAGFHVVLSWGGRWINLCPKCYAIVQEHAREIMKIVKDDGVALEWLLK